MNNDVLEFGLDELLAALQGAQVDGETTTASFTTYELRELTGFNEDKLRARLRVLRDRDMIECVKKPYVRLDGATVRVAAYRLKVTDEE